MNFKAWEWPSVASCIVPGLRVAAPAFLASPAASVGLPQSHSPVSLWVTHICSWVSLPASVLPAESQKSAGLPSVFVQSLSLLVQTSHSSDGVTFSQTLWVSCVRHRDLCHKTWMLPTDAFWMTPPPSLASAQMDGWIHLSPDLSKMLSSHTLGLSQWWIS